MKFFADENIARAIVIWLRNKGYDVAFTAEIQPGAPDADWLREAQGGERVIITSDKDFGELIFRDHLNSHGVILLRMEELTIAERIERLQSVWSVIEANPAGKFIVITEHKIRVRPLAIAKDDNGEPTGSS
jgi:predicted nuclease of predicted toxin-antitoxin system